MTLGYIVVMVLAVAWRCYLSELSMIEAGLWFAHGMIIWD